MSIVSEVLSKNPHALDTQVSSVWNIYNATFGEQSKAYKDADLMSKKIASTHTCDFEIYAVTGAKGRSGHSKTEIILLAVKAGDDVMRCGRGIRKLITVRG